MMSIESHEKLQVLMLAFPKKTQYMIHMSHDGAPIHCKTRTWEKTNKKRAAAKKSCYECCNENSKVHKFPTTTPIAIHSRAVNAPAGCTEQQSITQCHANAQNPALIARPALSPGPSAPTPCLALRIDISHDSVSNMYKHRRAMHLAQCDCVHPKEACQTWCCS